MGSRFNHVGPNTLEQRTLPNAHTPNCIAQVYDTRSTVADQLQWLTAAGFDARVVWALQDLAVIVAESGRRPTDQDSQS